MITRTVIQENPTMKRLLIGCVALMLTLGASRSVFAQTILNNTTLTTAITSVDTQQVVVASTTNMAVNDTVFIDQEAMQVNTVVSSTILRVTRGVRGTGAALHSPTTAGCAQCGVVFSGTPNRFKTRDPAPGYCNRVNIDFIPWINLSNGNNWTCISNTWRGTNTTPFTFNSVQTAQLSPGPVGPPRLLFEWLSLMVMGALIGAIVWNLLRRPIWADA